MIYGILLIVVLLIKNCIKIWTTAVSSDLKKTFCKGLWKYHTLKLILQIAFTKTSKWKINTKFYIAYVLRQISKLDGKKFFFKF